MRLMAVAVLLLPLVLAAAVYANEAGEPDAAAEAGVSRPRTAGLPAVVVEAQRASGPEVSETGAALYSASAEDINDLPAGSQTPMSDVLAQFPSVAIDQNQQIHIRSTEGPQFRYQINGLLVPLDINTNPPFISMLNTLFVDQLDLRVGVLPARYGYATGGVVDVRSKDRCHTPGGEVSVYGGQRATFSPSVEYAACSWAAGFTSALIGYGTATTRWSFRPMPTVIRRATCRCES
jgi:outer membrane cobalamin receptor